MFRSQSNGGRSYGRDADVEKLKLEPAWVQEHRVLSKTPSLKLRLASIQEHEVLSKVIYCARRTAHASICDGRL